MKEEAERIIKVMNVGNCPDHGILTNQKQPDEQFLQMTDIKNLQYVNLMEEFRGRNMRI